MCVALWPLPFTLKILFQGKRRIMETQIFHHAKIQSSKKSSKRNQNLSSCYNLITNLKFQHKPKYHLSKNAHIKIDLLLPRGHNPLSYYILSNESKHNILAFLVGKANNKPKALWGCVCSEVQTTGPFCTSKNNYLINQLFWDLL